MARVRAKLRDTDKGYRAMIRNVQIRNARVTVGVHEKDGAETYGKSGASVIDVAVWNELGTEHIPARPFIRLYFDGQQSRITGFALRAAQDIVRGKKTKTQAMHWLGQQMTADIRNAMKVGYFGGYPENAPSTLARKNGETPLIDTVQLWKSVDYRVRFQ